MIKKTLIALVALGSLSSAYAQEKEAQRAEDRAKMFRGVVTNKFGSNWEIGAAVGGQIYFGDHDKQMRFFDRLDLNLGVKAGKWWTPGIGVRLGVFGGNISGVSGWTAHENVYHPNANKYNYQGFVNHATVENGLATSGDVYKHTNHSYPLFETTQKYINMHGDVLFNVSHMVGGYNPERFYSFIPFASAGFALSLNKAVNGYYSHEATVGLGLINRFRLSEALDLDFEIRGTYTGDRFDQEFVADYGYEGRGYQAQAGRWGEGMLSASLGINYKIPRRGWEQPQVCPNNDDVIADLKKSLENQLALRENDAQRIKELENALNKQDEITRENVTLYPLLVTFHIDRWFLCNKNRVNLGFLAEALKANPNLKFKVTGFADAGTGSVKRNIFLAKKRSEVIYNCLVNEFGVPASQLIRDDKGGVENMYYNDPRCSRAVLLKVAE
jgi:putative outer membrane protein